MVFNTLILRAISSTAQNIVKPLGLELIARVSDGLKGELQSIMYAVRSICNLREYILIPVCCRAYRYISILCGILVRYRGY
jgi:hypothetical protein